jgi:hypothetical protein
MTRRRGRAFRALEPDRTGAGYRSQQALALTNGFCGLAGQAKTL